MQPAVAKPRRKIYYNVQTGQYLYYNSSTKQYLPCRSPQLHIQHGAYQLPRPPHNVPCSFQELHRLQQPSQQSLHVQQLQKPPITFQRFQLPENQTRSLKLRENEPKCSSHVVIKKNSDLPRMQDNKERVSHSGPQTHVTNHQEQLGQQKHNKKEQQQAQFRKKKHGTQPLPSLPKQSSPKTLDNNYENVQGRMLNSEFTSSPWPPIPEHDFKVETSASEHACNPGTSTLTSVLSTKPLECDTSVEKISRQLLISESLGKVLSKSEPGTTETQLVGKNELLQTKTEDLETKNERNVLQPSDVEGIGCAKIVLDFKSNMDGKSVGCFSSLHLGPFCRASGPAHLNKGPRNLGKGALNGTVHNNCLSMGSQKLELGPAQLSKGPRVVTAGSNQKFSGPTVLPKGPAGLASGSLGLLGTSGNNVVGCTVIPNGPSAATKLTNRSLAVGSANMAMGPSCSVLGSMKNLVYAQKADI